MKIKSLLCLLIVFITTIGYGQTHQIPKNLTEAVVILNAEFSDSLKNIIKQTKDEKLSDLFSDWNFFGIKNPVYNWDSEDVYNSDIVVYLCKKGIRRTRREVIFVAFKEFLKNGTFKEKSIIKSYRKIEKDWSKRNVADSIEGRYIPKNLDDCIKQLDLLMCDSLKIKSKQMAEDKFVRDNHFFGFGVWVRTNWRLGRMSRLSVYFERMGVDHPDNMSSVILTSYHRYLNRKEIRLDEQIRYYNRPNTELLEYFSEFNVGDTVHIRPRYEQNRRYSASRNKCLITGRVIQIDHKGLRLKIRLLEDCDNTGIVYDDNDGRKEYNKRTKRYEKPEKRVVKIMKVGESQWFDEDWWYGNIGVEKSKGK